MTTKYGYKKKDIQDSSGLTDFDWVCYWNAPGQPIPGCVNWS
jgi:hypothetical protein